MPLPALALVLLLTAPATLTPAEHLVQAERRYQALEPEKAILELQEVLNARDSSVPQRVHAYLTLGLCQLELFDTVSAASAFGQALDLDPTTRLPETAAPRALKLLEDQRAAHKARALSQREVRSTPSPRRAVLRPAWMVPGAVAVALLVVGAVLGGEASRISTQAGSAHFASDRAAETITAHTRATEANILYACGGGVALSSAALFVWGP